MSQTDDVLRWVLYGATGFTGRLILARALDLGLRPVVAGRSPAKVAELAQAHGLAHAAASVDDADALTGMLAGKSLVLNARRIDRRDESTRLILLAMEEAKD